MHIQYSPYGNNIALAWLKAFGILCITLHSHPSHIEEDKSIIYIEEHLHIDKQDIHLSVLEQARTI